MERVRVGEFYFVVLQTLNEQCKCIFSNKFLQQNPDELVNVAARGDSEKFEAILLKNPKSLHYADGNGWTALHAAVHAGRTEIVKRILHLGVDKNLLTLTGVTPLNIAQHSLPGNHELIKYLENIGAEGVSLFLWFCKLLISSASVFF